WRWASRRWRNCARSAMSSRAVRLLACLIAALAAFWGTWQRVAAARTAFLFGDEFHTLDRLGDGWTALVSTYDRVGSGLALPLMQRALGAVLGHGHWSLRGPALVG